MRHSGLPLRERVQSSAALPRLLNDALRGRRIGEIGRERYGLMKLLGKCAELRAVARGNYQTVASRGEAARERRTDCPGRSGDEYVHRSQSPQSKRRRRNREVAGSAIRGILAGFVPMRANSRAVNRKAEIARPPQNKVVEIIVT